MIGVNPAFNKASDFTSSLFSIECFGKVLENVLKKYMRSVSKSYFSLPKWLSKSEKSKSIMKENKHNSIYTYINILLKWKRIKVNTVRYVTDIKIHSEVNIKIVNSMKVFLWICTDTKDYQLKNLIIVMV